ncbi:protein argonaute-2 [Phlebotomus papatasi]|uniref:protein argonaute-2 n=1 Tax=Phlebotomus papatasi TaxID=29031 RepID=UPI002483C582|nr:protein argonaute-2 [Phlebotomus papatasi]
MDNPDKKKRNRRGKKAGGDSREEPQAPAPGASQQRKDPPKPAEERKPMEQLEKKLQKSLQIKEGDQKDSGGSQQTSEPKKAWKRKDLKKQKQEEAQESQGVGTSGPMSVPGGPQPSQLPQQFGPSQQSWPQEVQPQMRQPQQMQRSETPQSVSSQGDQQWGQRKQKPQYPKGQQKMQQQSYTPQSARDSPKPRPPSKAEFKSAPVTERREYSPAPEVALCPYKGPGTAGKRVKCDTNYVALNLQNLVDVAYHYDIAIDPDRPKKLLRNVFEAFRVKHFPRMTMAYDGNKLAYSVGQLTLPPGGLSDEITIDDVAMSRKKTYKVSIQETVDNQVHMILLKSGQAFRNEPDRGKVIRALQCLEIVMRMAAVGGIHVGRQYYWKPDHRLTLDNVMDLWTGIYHSAVFGSKPLVNVDVTSKGFPTEMPVLDVMFEHRIDLNRPDMRYFQSVKAHLNGLSVSYAPIGQEGSRRVYKFWDFKDAANRQRFTLDGKSMTVEQYYAEKRIRLKYPNLPVLHVGPKDKNIYLPAEFCIIPGGQAVMKKYTDNQTRSMIKHTATSTDERKRRILEVLKKVNFNQSEVVKGFGLNVGNQFETVDARILNAPTLEYARNKSQIPKDGVWQIRSEQFIVPTSINNWAVLVLEARRPEMYLVGEFVNKIISAGKALNMTIARPKDIKQIDIGRDYRKFDQEMYEYKKDNVDILLMVIPGFGEAYKKVKVAAEIQYGILTQCIKHDTIVRRGDLSTINNILLKMNSKLNGLNHRILSENRLKLGILRDGNFMVVGADVTHPSPGQNNVPSIVGVASSYDEDGFKYTGMWRIQAPKQEIIDDLANMVAEHLSYYRKTRNVLPHTILYYRDGVGEGHFQTVLDVEYKAIHVAASRIPDYKPKVVFIVVQKRHHTRFFPPKGGPNKCPSIGRNFNVPPGTIVDTTIVPLQQNQFFLVAHQAIQGVAKPTKYCVLVDEAEMSIDDLQALTYNLCYMFTRCNRSVSYVAPTYYAHLMAARGKVYVDGEHLKMHDLEMEYRKRIINDDVGVKHPMFFV